VHTITTPQPTLRMSEMLLGGGIAGSSAAAGAARCGAGTARGLAAAIALAPALLTATRLGAGGCAACWCCGRCCCCCGCLVASSAPEWSSPSPVRRRLRCIETSEPERPSACGEQAAKQAGKTAENGEMAPARGQLLHQLEHLQSILCNAAAYT
jgi:hypothetical protein